MRAKHWILAGTVAALTVAGCGEKQTVYTSPDGGKVSQDSQGNVTVEDGKGNKVDYKTNKDGSYSMKSDTGAEFKGDASGFTGKDDKGNEMSMGTSTVTEAQLGVPFYPGSDAVSGKDMQVVADGKQSYVSFRSTSDSPEKVAEFYKGKVKGPTVTSSASNSAVTGKLDSGADFMMFARVDGGKTEIQIATSKPK